MNRKDFLKSLGLIGAGATLIGGGESVKAAGRAMGVTMSFYEDSDFRIAQSPSFVAKNNVKKELYVSLSGEPQTSGGKYESGSFSPSE